MSRHELVVALGSLRYRIERPFGAWPTNAGRVTDVTVGSGRNVYVMLRHDPFVDPEHPRVIVLSPDGDYLSAWGGAEIADSHSLTATADGRILAVDRDMHEVIIFSADGRRLGGIGTRGQPHQPFNHPTDAAVAPLGDIYVSDGYAGWSIHRFAGDGTHRQTWGALGSGPGQFLESHSLWCLSDGRVVVVDRCNHRLQVFDASGAYVAEWGGFRRPVAIWGDNQDRLFVIDEVPSLHCLTSDGIRLGRARPVLNGAHGICGTNDGVIYLAEANPSRITRLIPLSG